MLILTWEKLKNICNEMNEEDLQKGVVIKIDENGYTCKSVIDNCIITAYLIPEFENLK